MIRSRIHDGLSLESVSTSLAPSHVSPRDLASSISCSLVSSRDQNLATRTPLAIALASYRRARTRDRQQLYTTCDRSDGYAVYVYTGVRVSAKIIPIVFIGHST